MGDYRPAVSGAEPTTRFLWIRHGRVADEWHGRLYGDLDVPLSEAGREEARRVAERLAGERLDLVVSSGLQRTEQLAALLRAPRGLPRRDEPDLREIDRGDWRGQRPEDLGPDQAAAWEAWLARPAELRPPGGESLADLAARVLPRARALAQELPGGSVAVVAHAWVVRVVVCATLAIPLDHAPRLAVPTGGLVVVDWPSLPGSHQRPTLTGFALAAPPETGSAWFRGPPRPPR